MLRWSAEPARTRGSGERVAGGPGGSGNRNGWNDRIKATFRLLQQTNRSSRFAQVTVEVAPSDRVEVDVRAAADGGYRREAEPGCCRGERL